MSGGEQENQHVRSQSARPKNRRGENKHGTQNQSATERDSETSSPPDLGYDHGDMLLGVMKGSHTFSASTPPCQQHLKAGTHLSEAGETRVQVGLEEHRVMFGVFVDGLQLSNGT